LLLEERELLPESLIWIRTRSRSFDLAVGVITARRFASWIVSTESLLHERADSDGRRARAAHAAVYQHALTRCALRINPARGGPKVREDLSRLYVQHPHATVFHFPRAVACALHGVAGHAFACAIDDTTDPLVPQRLNGRLCRTRHALSDPHAMLPKLNKEGGALPAASLDPRNSPGAISVAQPWRTSRPGSTSPVLGRPR
jgi:hypothetical protein